MMRTAQITALLLMGLVGPAFGAATEAPDKEKAEQAGTGAGFSELPATSVPSTEVILDAVRERLVAQTKQDMTRRAALKEEAERQRKIRQGLRDAGVDLTYLPVPDAIRELERMTPSQSTDSGQRDVAADGRSDNLYSAIETSQEDNAGLGVERVADQEVLLRVLCNDKGSDLDSRTLQKIGVGANEARDLANRICP